MDGLLGEEIEGDDLEETLEEVLDWVVAAAPPGPKVPAACFCVRPDAQGFVGAVRVDDAGAFHVRTVRGESRRAVALAILGQCAAWDGTRKGDKWFRERDECCRARCPGGALSFPPPAPKVA